MPKLLSLVAVNELKTIIFVLNYLTVLVYTNTIIHLNVRLEGGDIYRAAKQLPKYPSLAISTSVNNNCYLPPYLRFCTSKSFQAAVQSPQRLERIL